MNAKVTKWTDCNFKAMGHDELLRTAEWMAESLDSSYAALAAERKHRGSCAFNARRIHALEAEIERLKKAEVK